MCAPQNFSADLLFKALSAAGITTEYMIRLNDPRVPPTQVSPHVVAVHCILSLFCCCALYLASKLSLCSEYGFHIVAVLAFKLLLCIALCPCDVAVRCLLPLYCCCALQLAPLLLCIAYCRHIIAVHCTLPLCFCRDLDFASEVLPNNSFAMRQS